MIFAGLKADRYVRVTAGKLPEADFAFLDDAHPEARRGFVIEVIAALYECDSPREMIAARSAAETPTL